MVVQSSGCPLSQSKTVGPAQTLVFLGVEIDVLRQFAHPPRDKLDLYLSILKALLSSCTLNAMHSIIGHLNWWASLIPSGHSYLRCLIDTTCGLRNPSVLISLTPEVKAELSMWVSFLEQYNGYSFLKCHRLLSEALVCV